VSATLASIWRHPVKAIGRERLEAVELAPARALPWDRRWAVTHARAAPEALDPEGGWANKVNFLRGVSGPWLMAVESELDEASARVTLRHPDRGEITAAPDDPADAARLVRWLDPIWPADLPRPTGLRALDTGFTDVPEGWVSIHVHASHRAVEGRAGRPLSIHRWRGNLWIDGAELWDEWGWVGRRLHVGAAVLEVRARIGRCKATMANPETGARDVDTLALLRSWEHQDFGVYAEVVEGGRVAAGDPVRAT
jgi:uncharacterized protein YcbX